jgi:pyruvate dehydrogenase E2 component (dihydrolipoamide acetyltransferase)
MAVEVFMPKMSDHMEAGEIVNWLVGENEQVEQGQAIVEIVTDKVTAEIEAPADGVLKGIRPGLDKGAVVPVGETIAFIAQGDEEIPALAPLADAGAGPAVPEPGTAAGTAVREDHELRPVVDASPVAKKLAEQHGIDLGEVAGGGRGGRIQKEDVLAFKAGRGLAWRVKASPAARRRARELGLDLKEVTGTGPDGIIREADVETFSKGGTAPAAPAAAGTVEWLDLSMIERRTGERMSMSASTAPQFTISLRADVEKLLCIRDILSDQMVKEAGKRVTITTLLVKIVAHALREHPRVNSEHADGRLKIYREINVGVAVGGPRGLTVPVVHRADLKSISQIDGEIRSFSQKAEEMRFSSGELAGGTFTISNLGMYGIESFNAIVNPPQSSILAVGRIVKTPVGDDDERIVLRPMMHLSLTVDHRCMDGIQGAQFLNTVKETIESPGLFVHG